MRVGIIRKGLKMSSLFSKVISSALLLCVNVALAEAAASGTEEVVGNGMQYNLYLPWLGIAVLCVAVAVAVTWAWRRRAKPARNFRQEYRDHSRADLGGTPRTD